MRAAVDLSDVDAPRLVALRFLTEAEDKHPGVGVNTLRVVGCVGPGPAGAERNARVWLAEHYPWILRLPLYRGLKEST